MTELDQERTTSGAADLSLAEIVATAVHLLDEGGLSGFTMRALGQRLGRSQMAAYRYVDDRDELVRLAAQAVQYELPDVDGLPWHARLEAYARHGWRTSWRPHPWLVDLIGSGTMTRFEQRRLERMTQIFRDAGFDDADITRALVAHWSFVIGTLQLIRTIGARGDAPDADEIFEFNLRSWILGLGAKAANTSLDTFPGPAASR